MAFFNRIVFVLAILTVALLPATTIATDYVVGDGSRWTVNFDYQAWASDKTFKVGDNLVFTYTKGLHNVFQVDGYAYVNCLVPPPSEAHTSGHDIINLTAPGYMWFICGIGIHCRDNNQKLSINVKA